jgi:hypothetical protein
MPPAASLGLGAALVNKWDRWSPNTTVVELLGEGQPPTMSAPRGISRARDDQVAFGKKADINWNAGLAAQSRMTPEADSV